MCEVDPIDCQCGDEWRDSREFCERHQMLYCRRCEGRCPDCRYTDSWEDDEDEFDNGEL